MGFDAVAHGRGMTANVDGRLSTDYFIATQPDPTKPDV